MKFFRTLV